MSSFSLSFIDEVESAIANKDLDRLDSMASAYFQPAGRGPSPFSAAVELTEEGREAIFPPDEARAGIENESALMLDAANFVERGRRLVKYKYRKLKDPSAVRIVAEGDSWFQYPFLLNDVIDVLIEKYAVCCLSAGGDTVANMVRWPEYLEAIEAEQPVVFLFSGGGNDLVGDGRLRKILKPYTPGAEPRDLIDSNTFGQILRQVIVGYEQMLTSLSDRFPGLRMLGHGYDHPKNIGAGPWIKPYLDEANIPLSLGADVIAHLLDSFGSELAKLKTRHRNFEYISVAGKVGGSAEDWYDALHPKDPGYRRVANAFIEKIEALRASLEGMESFAAKCPSDGGSGRVYAAKEYAQSHESKRTFALPSFAYPEWFDFGPEGTWIKFDHPKVHQHIREVISLLEQRGAPEDREIVRNRLRLRPAEHLESSAARAFDLDAQAEAIIGSNDLEDIQTLLVGYRASRTVGLLALRTASGVTTPRGTGVIVGPNLLLTNNHVLASAAEAQRHVLIMDDERDLVGTPKHVRRFRITPNIFVTDDDYDFTLVSLEPFSDDGTDLTSYGGLRLEELSGKAIKGETLCIIQHPSGGPKSVSIRNSHAMGRVGEGFYYTSDTQKGSSGSAVLNRDWQLVALHHRTVPHPTTPGEYIANRGIRVSAIVERLSELAVGGNKQAERVRELLATPLVIASEQSSDMASIIQHSGEAVAEHIKTSPPLRHRSEQSKEAAASRTAAATPKKEKKNIATSRTSRTRKSR